MSHVLVTTGVQSSAGMTATMKFTTIAVCTFLVLFLALLIPEFVFTHYLEASAVSLAPPMKTRSGAVQSLDVTNQELRDISRRIDLLENQQAAVRLSVIESRVNTMFELGRIILGAAVVSLCEALWRGIKWSISRKAPG